MRRNRYTTDGFLEKNKDRLHPDATSLLASSTLSLVAELFSSPADASTSDKKKSKGTSSGSKSRRKKSRRGSTMRIATLGHQFRSQLSLLMTAVRSTQPHYVRCLKPNAKASPRLFDRPNIVRQLRCGGVLEAIRVARLGYPVRLSHEEFIQRWVVGCA